MHLLPITCTEISHIAVTNMLMYFIIACNILRCFMNTVNDCCYAQPLPPRLHLGGCGEKVGAMCIRLVESNARSGTATMQHRKRQRGMTDTQTHTIHPLCDDFLID